MELNIVPETGEHGFEEFEKEAELEPANNWKRLANYFIDLIVIYLLIFAFSFFIAAILKLTSPDLLYKMMSIEDNALLSRLIGFVFAIIYYATFETFTGRTAGKHITKTKVVMDDGTKPDFKTIIIRSLCRFIPFEPFSFFGSGNDGWHDSISKTKVVKVS